jgi:hypothetical protein
VEYLLTGIPANLENEMNEDAYMNNMLQQQMAGNQPQPGNMPSNSGLRMPGQSGSLGYGNVQQQQQQQQQQQMPQVGQPMQQPMQQPISPQEQQPSSQHPQQPMQQQQQQQQYMPQVGQPIQNQSLLTQPQMQLSPEMLALSMNPQFQMIRSSVQQNPGSLQF